MAQRQEQQHQDLTAEQKKEQAIGYFVEGMASGKLDKDFERLKKEQSKSDENVFKDFFLECFIDIIWQRAAAEEPKPPTDRLVAVAGESNGFRIATWSLAKSIFVTKGDAEGFPGLCKSIWDKVEAARKKKEQQLSQGETPSAEVSNDGPTKTPQSVLPTQSVPGPNNADSVAVQPAKNNDSSSLFNFEEALKDLFKNDDVGADQPARPLTNLDSVGRSRPTFAMKPSGDKDTPLDIAKYIKRRNNELLDGVKLDDVPRAIANIEAFSYKTAVQGTKNHWIESGPIWGNLLENLSVLAPMLPTGNPQADENSKFIESVADKLKKFVEARTKTENASPIAWVLSHVHRSFSTRGGIVLSAFGLRSAPITAEEMRRIKQIAHEYEKSLETEKEQADSESLATNTGNESEELIDQGGLSSPDEVGNKKYELLRKSSILNQLIQDKSWDQLESEYVSDYESYVEFWKKFKEAFDEWKPLLVGAGYIDLSMGAMLDTLETDLNDHSGLKDFEEIPFLDVTYARVQEIAKNLAESLADEEAAKTNEEAAKYIVSHRDDIQVLLKFEYPNPTSQISEAQSAWHVFYLSFSSLVRNLKKNRSEAGVVSGDLLAKLDRWNDALTEFDSEEQVSGLVQKIKRFIGGPLVPLNERELSQLKRTVIEVLLDLGLPYLIEDSEIPSRGRGDLEQAKQLVKRIDGWLKKNIPQSVRKTDDKTRNELSTLKSAIKSKISAFEQRLPKTESELAHSFAERGRLTLSAVRSVISSWWGGTKLVTKEEMKIIAKFLDAHTTKEEKAEGVDEAKPIPQSQKLTTGASLPENPSSKDVKRADAEPSSSANKESLTLIEQMKKKIEDLYYRNIGDKVSTANKDKLDGRLSRLYNLFFGDERLQEAAAGFYFKRDDNAIWDNIRDILTADFGLNDSQRSQQSRILEELGA